MTDTTQQTPISVPELVSAKTHPFRTFCCTPLIWDIQLLLLSDSGRKLFPQVPAPGAHRKQHHNAKQTGRLTNLQPKPHLFECQSYKLLVQGTILKVSETSGLLSAIKAGLAGKV